jgi:hypothetical protein
MLKTTLRSNMFKDRTIITSKYYQETPPRTKVICY